MLSRRSRRSRRSIPPTPTIDDEIKSESYQVNTNTDLNSSAEQSCENGGSILDESNQNDNAGLIHKNPFISPDKKPLTLKRVTAF
jgi:hypothetical protein